MIKKIIVVDLDGILLYNNNIIFDYIVDIFWKV